LDPRDTLRHSETLVTCGKKAPTKKVQWGEKGPKALTNGKGENISTGEGVISREKKNLLRNLGGAVRPALKHICSEDYGSTTGWAQNTRALGLKLSGPSRTGSPSRLKGSTYPRCKAPVWPGGGGGVGKPSFQGGKESCHRLPQTSPGRKNKN